MLLVKYPGKERLQDQRGVNPWSLETSLAWRYMKSCHVVRVGVKECCLYIFNILKGTGCRNQTKREAAMLCTRQEKRNLGFINVHVGWSAGGQTIVAIQQNFACQWFQKWDLFQWRRREEEVCFAEDQQATVANGITARPARQDLPG